MKKLFLQSGKLMCGEFPQDVIPEPMRAGGKVAARSQVEVDDYNAAVSAAKDCAVEVVNKEALLTPSLQGGQWQHIEGNKYDKWEEGQLYNTPEGWTVEIGKRYYSTARREWVDTEVQVSTDTIREIARLVPLKEQEISEEEIHSGALKVDINYPKGGMTPSERQKEYEAAAEQQFPILNLQQEWQRLGFVIGACFAERQAWNAAIDKAADLILNHVESDASYLSAELEKLKLYVDCTEEGKRLTAEEPEKDPLQKSVDTALDNLIEISKSMVQLSEHQLDIKNRLDRFEGRLKGSLFGD